MLKQCRFRCVLFDAYIRTGNGPTMARPALKTENWRTHYAIFVLVQTRKAGRHSPTQEEMARMGKLIEDSMKSGKLLATEGCLPSAKGARVRLSGGNYKVIDGPFTESKELVAGFALIQAASKEEAIEIIKDFLKVAGDGETEMRQIFEPGMDFARS
jgi:hypothetical protein